MFQINGDLVLCKTISFECLNIWGSKATYKTVSLLKIKGFFLEKSSLLARKKISQKILMNSQKL